jgi:AP-2 complex subunit mu-1
LAEDVFKTQIAENKDKVEGPVINVAGVSFIWMRHSNVYLVLVTKNNANVMLAMKFLSQVHPRCCSSL